MSNSLYCEDEIRQISKMVVEYSKQINFQEMEKLDQVE
jgi:hypothetical protein